MKKSAFFLIFISVFIPFAYSWTPIYGFPKPGGIPSGFGGQENSSTNLKDQAKEKAVKKIINSVMGKAFKGGLIVASKQKWACDKLDQAESIVQVLKKPKLLRKVNNLQDTLYCKLSESIPLELLAEE